jgi:D-glycero-beta-D-manno-heptose-7-phosphate kinase
MAKASVPKSRSRRIIGQFSHASIMVVGDAMLDEYLWGTASRISPEAPVPVVEVESHTLKLGGAANVAANLKRLGITPHLVALCGADADGERLRSLIHEGDMSSEGLFVSRSRPTTLKTRVMAQHQQIVRADHESRRQPDDEEFRLMLSHVRSLAPDMDAVILSDYAKGVLAPPAARAFVAACRDAKIFIAVDPKQRDFSVYAGANVITPNLKEARQALGLEVEPYSEEQVRELGWQLIDLTRLPLLLVTLGEHGMALFEREKRAYSHLHTTAQKVYDVTGAGDTVISAFTAACACGATPQEAAFVANHAAGLTVAELGTATVDPEALAHRCAEGQPEGEEHGA